MVISKDPYQGVLAYISQTKYATKFRVKEHKEYVKSNIFFYCSTLLTGNYQFVRYFDKVLSR